MAAVASEKLAERTATRRTRERMPWRFATTVLAATLCAGTTVAHTYSASVSTVPQPVWSVDGVPITNGPGGQGVGVAGKPGLTMVADGEGGVFIAWEDLGNATAFAQRLNAAGQPLWGPAGVDVATAQGFKFSPRAVSDGAGGVLIAWVDGRNGFCDPAFQGECDIFAQHLDAQGHRLWQPDGVPVTVAPGNQGVSGIAIATDGSGGAILSWEDARPPDCCRIFAQRINASGHAVWAPDGIPISPPPTIVIGPIGTPPRAVSDATGGAIIAWLNTQVNPIAERPTVAVQRIDANGQALWSADGISVGFPVKENFGSLAPDGADGAILAWSVVGQDGFADLVTQRVSASGQTLWQAGGVSLAAAPFQQLNPDVVSDGAGGAITVWQDERDGAAGDCERLVGNCNIYAQRVSAAGYALWPANGVPVSTAPNTQISPQAVEDGSGGAVIAWQDCRDFPDLYSCGFSMDIYAQRVNAAGQTLWAANGVPVSRAPGNQGIPPGTPFFDSLVIVTDGTGGGILGWADGRDGICQEISPEGCEVFAERISDRPDLTRRCTGDCNNDHAVTVDEIVTLVSITLGNADPPACPNGFPAGSDVDITLIIQAVNNALNGCSG